MPCTTVTRLGMHGGRRAGQRGSRGVPTATPTLAPTCGHAGRGTGLMAMQNRQRGSRHRPPAPCPCRTPPGARGHRLALPALPPRRAPLPTPTGSAQAGPSATTASRCCPRLASKPAPQWAQIWLLQLRACTSARESHRQPAGTQDGDSSNTVRSTSNYTSIDMDLQKLNTDLSICAAG